MYLPNGIACQKRCVLLLSVVLVAACTAPSDSQAGLGAVAAQESSSSPVSETAVQDEAPPSELLSDSYRKCASSNDGSVWGMQECVEAEFKNQDARLNSVYKALMSKLPPDERVKLKEEERKWIAEKESTCAWDPESEGQAQRIAANICSLEKTSERATYLAGKL